MFDPTKLDPIAGDCVRVIVETPAGRRSKYKWDPESECFSLSKVLPVGMAFPYDFGFVPGTHAADGDPLDALVLADEPLAIGCLVRCRVIGGLEVHTSDPGSTATVKNDRIITVPTAAIAGAIYQRLDDLGPLLTGIEAFFRTYTEREGRVFELRGTTNAREAMELVTRAATRALSHVR